MVAKTTKALFLVVCFFTSILPSQAAEHESIFIGVTEPSHIWGVGEKIKTPFVIRIAFQYKDGIWKALPSKAKRQAGWLVPVYDYPREIDWNLTFNGKKIGEFRSYCPLKWSESSDIGLAEPDRKAHIPLIKAGAKNFLYWGDPWAVPPHSRPLVASSGSYFDDPDNWRPLVPLPQPSRTLISAYRKALGSEANHLRNKQISVKQCYRSRHGDELISLAVPSSEVKGEYDYVQWFHVQGNRISFLGSSLELIDAGDYDHDGYSEIVFHKGGYDYDAYVLVYDDLRKQLKFGWSYH